MATKWDRLLELRPRQGKDMSVQAYYDEFYIWKEKMEEQNYLADEQSYVDDFLCWLKWDLVVRVWSYKSKPQILSDALQRARFEESMMKIEAYFHTPVEVNEAADSNPTLVKEISIQDVGGVANENGVNEGNKEDFSDVIDEGHLQILQMKAKEGKVFDEMLHPNSVDVMEIQEDWSVLKSKLGDITQSNTLNVVDDSPEDANMDETRNEVELKIMDDMAPNTTQVIKIPISPAILTDKYVQDNQSSMLVDDKLCLDKLYLRLDAITNSLLPNPWYACEKYVQNGEKLGTKFICQSSSTTHRECKGVILLIDTMVMFYFDPGGCHLPQMGCDLFELNGEQGDHCFTTNADDASVRFDEYCNDAFSGESVSPFSKFVPILELAMSIQIGFIMKAYVVLTHARMLPNRELRQVFVEWNREKFPILMIEETIIIVKTNSDLKGEWSSTPEFLNDQDFWWISLFVYLNTIEERGSQLGAHIHVMRVVQNDICLPKGLKPLVLWLKTGELDGSLLDENFTQPPQLFCKWIVWRIASLTVRSLSKARFGVAHLTGIQEIGEPYDILVKQIGLIVDFQAGSMRESETYFSEVLARIIYRLFSSSQNESALLNLLQMHFYKSYSYVKLVYLMSAFGSEPESPWKRISELVLGDDSDLWVDIFGDAFLHRMEAIIHPGFEELMQFQCKASLLDDQARVNECSVDASCLDHLKHGNVLLMSMIGLSKVPRKSGVLIMQPGLCTIFVYILEDKDVLKRKGIGVRLVLKQDEWLNGTGIHYNPHMKFSACFLVDWELLSLFITSSKFRIGKLKNLMGLFVTSFDYNCLRFNNDYSSSNQTSWIGCKGFDLEDAIDVNNALSVIWVLVQTKWDNNCQGAFQSYPPAVSVNAQILNGFLHINSYSNINVLKLDDSVMATLLATLFKLGYAVVTTPLKAMLRVFILMLFWKHQWGCRKAFGLVAVGILENFVWDPGLVWVSHFTTLRTRRLLRGRICHVLRLKN